MSSDTGAISEVGNTSIEMSFEVIALDLAGFEVCIGDWRDAAQLTAAFLFCRVW